VSTYELILLVCITAGFLLALLLAFAVSERGWRRVTFALGFAVEIVYVGIQPRGYDRWDAFAAIVFGGAVLIGWTAGFGVAALARR
jgi:hypothetical protein